MYNELLLQYFSSYKTEFSKYGDRSRGVNEEILHEVNHTIIRKSICDYLFNIITSSHISNYKKSLFYYKFAKFMLLYLKIQ